MEDTSAFCKIKTPPVFNLELMLDCGQAFRWKKDENGILHGVIGTKKYSLKQVADELIIYGNNADGFDHRLKEYLDFDRDYKTIIDAFSKDKYLNLACCEYNGIRILKQDEWEALCSFIISQNNNIPRIKGIIERLCESFGEKICEGCYTFPSAKVISEQSVEALAPLRAGFRAKYIIDAAQKVVSGEVDFDFIKNGSLEDGRSELLKIKGVGNKVAECALLYGFGKLDAFPIDVWVKRIVSELYPEGLPDCMENYHGIAQQYLFHWRRNSSFFDG